MEGDGLLVDRDGLLRDLLPRELFDAALPPCLSELFGERGIAGEAVHLGREIGLECGDELRVGCPGRIVRNEQARCAVDSLDRKSVV